MLPMCGQQMKFVRNHILYKHEFVYILQHLLRNRHKHVTIDPRKLVERRTAESSAEVARRVMKAREMQRDRFAGEGIFCNAAMNNRQIEKYCPLSSACKAVLERIIERMGLSARACSRIIKLARTIADLASVPEIRPEHIAEAAGYRFLDRQNIFE